MFGERVNKLSVDMGFTCPNRDGSIAQGGCVYCNNDSFVPPYARVRHSMRDQIENGKEYLTKRFKAKKFIIYFQAYTNTYADVSELERMYREALSYPDVVGIAVGTRSDCIDEEKLDMFEKLARECYVTLEYGIESTYDKTLEFMNRGHDYGSVVDAIELTKGRGIEIGAHIIVGMPTETREEMLAMRAYELMVIFDGDLDDAGADAALATVTAGIEGLGATVASTDRWGKRRFAYEIDHIREGYYSVLTFNGDSDAVQTLDRALALSDPVIRHKFVRLEHMEKVSQAPGTMGGVAATGEQESE